METTSRTQYLRATLIFSVITLLFACGGGGSSSEATNDGAPTTPTPETSPTEVENTSPNILFIIADDMGKDSTNGFSEGTVKPYTPNIDNIADNGLTFSNFWSYPVCSPTRASIITGKNASRTGVKWAGDAISSDETVLQKYINDELDGTYATAVIGKWHISGNRGQVNPEDFGIDYYAGVLAGTEQYYDWSLYEDGESSVQTSYITEKFTDLSIEWVNQQDKPWFLWLAYTAPHTPFHAPPASMHAQGNLAEYEDGLDAIPYYMAAIEAMDFQIGRLLLNMPEEDKENLVIIFIGDNGTPNQVTQSPYDRSRTKGTLYQGGINTPMFVSGVGVERWGVDDNLISSTDLFATIAELTGVETTEIHDSKSFLSLFSSNEVIREYQYAEMDSEEPAAWAISDGVYKLIVDADGAESFYNLYVDPYEDNPIATSELSDVERAIKEDLMNRLAVER